MDEEEGNSVQKPSCCSTVRFLGVKEAQGFAILGVTRGTIVMSNIYLSSSLLYLANVEAGCDMDDVNNCSKEVFGFRPSSLLTITVTVSGVLAALLMPVIGAIVDFTPHRKLLGILSAFSIVMIQSIQILTNQKTWFVMSILQALAGFLYIVQVLATYAYLPEVGRLVDELTMTKFTSRFTMIQFGGQSLYLIIITAVALVFELNEVKLAQCSQTINAFIIIIFFTIAWKLLPSRPQLHDLNGKNLIMAGFIQNWNTMKGINKHYAKGLRFFLIASCFTSAGANAFSTISVTYLYEVLQMKGNEIGIIFLISLVISVPGAFFGGFVTGKTNPITSLKINLISFSLVTVAAAFILTGPSRTNICYIFACLWGICLGWYYPTSALIFSLSVPKGQESELSGFFTYCTQIIVWLPPLVFTIMNESGINMKWGLMSLVIFFLIGIIFLQLMLPWSSVVIDAKNNKIIAQREWIEQQI